MADEKTAERKLKWDEENRLLASDDNGFVTNYWYDADGERTEKTSPEIYGKPHLGSCRPAAYGRIETVSERGYRGIRRCEIPGIQRLLESGNSCSEQYQLPEGRSGRKAV